MAVLVCLISLAALGERTLSIARSSKTPLGALPTRTRPSTFTPALRSAWTNWRPAIRSALSA